MKAYKVEVESETIPGREESYYTTDINKAKKKFYLWISECDVEGKVTRNKYSFEVKNNNEWNEETYYVSITEIEIEEQ